MATISITKKKRLEKQNKRLLKVERDIIKKIAVSLDNGERDFRVYLEYNFRIDRRKVIKDLTEAYKKQGWKNIEITDKSMFVYVVDFKFKF